MDRRRLVPGLVTLGLALVTAGGIALAADITCTGEIGRDSDAPTCRGTPQDDVITGSPQRDNVVAGGGNDIVNGGDGMDFLQGRKGDDELNGDANPDWLDGRTAPITIGGPGPTSMSTT